MTRRTRTAILSLVLLAITVGQAYAAVPGQPLWMRRHTSAVDQNAAVGIAIDSKKNVYVLGYNEIRDRDHPWQNSDYITVKYDSAGNRLWTRRFDGPYRGHDIPRAIGVDGAGNVYVTGSSEGSGGEGDFGITTVMYDSAGNRKWVRRYKSPKDGWKAHAGAMAVGPDGNVVVSGYTGIPEDDFPREEAPRADSDYVTIKYDSAGSRHWVRHYRGLNKGADVPVAIGLDNDGNTHVTGTSASGSGSSYKFTVDTVKYGPSGNTKWVRRYKETRGVGAGDLALDGQGNVYITGTSVVGDRNDRNPDYDYVTVKYGSGGNRKWVRRYDRQNGYDRPASLACDNDGNIFVTGTSPGANGNADFATIKYDGAGNRKWVRLYNGPGNGDDEPIALAVADSGNVYITGGSATRRYGMAYTTLKYDTRGDLKWTARYNHLATGRNYARALAVDAGDNVVVTGTSSDDFATIKYAP